MSSYLKKAAAWVKKEIIFTVIFCLIVLSLWFVPPSPAYVSYINFDTLFILFSLMTVVAGFSSCGIFTCLGALVCKSVKTERTLAVVLVFLCFFTAMLITNDVALLTFVPFAITLLRKEKQEYLVFVIVLQTIAANTGSMLTPIGNPQNLFLFSQEGFSLGSFIMTMLPLTVCSGLLLAAVIFIFVPNTATENAPTGRATPAAFSIPVKRASVYTVLFILSLSAVVHVIPSYAAAVVIFVYAFIFDRESLARVDFMLLLTFVCFFIFTGNIAAIESVRNFLQAKIQGAEFWAGVAVSQIISNVPATLMLHPFSGSSRELLLGVNTGGLGTLVASLASLISSKLYMKTPQARPLYFLGVFTLFNVVFLVLMILFKCFIMGGSPG